MRINLKFKKKQKSLASILDDIELIDNDESLNQIISKHCIIPLINNLDLIDIEALMRSEIQKVPQKELAKQLNISYSGAKSSVQRGREKLKELLMDCCNLKSDAYGNILENNNGNCC